MALKKIRLGDYIKKSTRNNKDLHYDEKLIIGVTNNGLFSKPKGNIQGVDLRPYKIVTKGAFVYNPSRLDIGSLAYYDKEELSIVSHLYIIFYLNENGLKAINPIYLYIYLRRREFQREVTFRNFGSQRPEFNFNDMSDIELDLPDIATQEKFVKVYLSMVENQKAYERGLDDLKLVCDGFIEDLRKKMPCEKIGKYLKIRRDKNVDNRIKNVYGVSNSLKFITASSSVDTSNLSDYKVVNFEDIAYVPTTHMKIWAVAISTIKEPFVVSPIYEVFSVKDKDKILPDYLFLWLCNEGIIKYAFYNSWGSARENFVFDDLCTISIPIPSLDVQKSIVEIFNALNLRKQINERLKEQIKNICPILIKGSIEEARGE